MFAARSDPDRACGSTLAESVLAARRKDLAHAQARALAASALADASGLDHQQVWASWQLACVAMAAEDLDSALAHLSRAAAIASRIGESAMVDLVLEAERLGTHLKQLQRERKLHWEAWTNLQLAEQEASTPYRRASRRRTQPGRWAPRRLRLVGHAAGVQGPHP
jgi:hypothetical protein